MADFWQMRGSLTLAAASLAATIALAPVAGATVVLSNGIGGDLFTNPGPSNTGQAVGASGWVYNNVRVDGEVGISGDYARSGNGSVRLATQGVAAPGTTNSKADIEYLGGATQLPGGNFAATASLGNFSDLSSMVYDWYRDSVSTNNAIQHPALRVLLAVPTLTGFVTGGLVFERAYNGGGVSTDTWVTDAIGATTNLWNFGLGLGFAADPLGKGAYNTTLADWQSVLAPGTQIIGFSAGVGSGWGFFEGAVDNIGWTIADVTTTANFEVAAVPLPAGGLLLIGGLALLGVAGRRRAA